MRVFTRSLLVLELGNLGLVLLQLCLEETITVGERLDLLLIREQMLLEFLVLLLCRFCALYRCVCLDTELCESLRARRRGAIDQRESRLGSENCLLL